MPPTLEGPDQRSPASLTPIGAVVRGLVAGAVGTAAMDAFLFARYRRGGGQSGLVEGLFDIKLPASRVPLVNNVTHWAFGIFGGAQYGLVAGSLPTPRIRYGLPFGATVWASGDVVLPAAKLYEPIWKYDAKTLANDLSAHLVYGLATATALRVLAP